VSDDAARTADGRLFHSRGEATENDRSPRVDRLTDTVSDVRRSCAVDTAERENTEAEPYPLWDAQPVEIAQERRDAFRTPR